FRATFTAPPGALVTLRASASDTLGGSVTESITRAYRTAPAAAGQPAALAAHHLTAQRLAPQHLAARAGHPAGPPARRAGPAATTRGAGGHERPAVRAGASRPGPVRPALPGSDHGQPCGREGSPAARLGGPRPGGGLPAAGEPAQPPDRGGVDPVPHPAPGPL